MAYFKVFNEMTWPDPHTVGEIEWILRYGEPTKSNLMVAASIVGGYKDLIFKPQKARDKIIKELRKNTKA